MVYMQCKLTSWAILGWFECVLYEPLVEGIVNVTETGVAELDLQYFARTFRRILPIL